MGAWIFQQASQFHRLTRLTPITLTVEEVWVILQIILRECRLTKSERSKKNFRKVIDQVRCPMLGMMVWWWWWCVCVWGGGGGGGGGGVYEAIIYSEKSY